MKGFNPIPFDDIGLVKDQFRTDPPDKNTYRRKVYGKYANDPGGRYDPRKVNARYPEPSYFR